MKPEPAVEHKVVACRCGHFAHYLGIGKCLECLCPEYRADDHVYPLGHWATS